MGLDLQNVVFDCLVRFGEIQVRGEEQFFIIFFVRLDGVV